MAFLASKGFLEAQEQPRGSQRGSGRPREAQGDARSSSEMSGASFRKIRFFGPGRRLAVSEGPKIAPSLFSFVPAKLEGESKLFV